MRRLPAVLPVGVRAVLPAVVAVALLAAGCSAGTEEPVAEPTSAGVERFEDLSTDHVDGPVAYEQTPPVGGEHNARWLACDVYDEQVPPELAVHSLEHGAVWLTHDPDLPADQVAAFADLASTDEEYVLVSPFEGLPSPVVASAWGLQLQVGSADDPALRAFVDEYAGGGQGGEPGAPCRSGGLTPGQARDLLGNTA